METIIKFKAFDGHEFSTELAALAHEALLNAIKLAITPLGDLPKDDGCSFSNGGGYLQHTPKTVEAVKNAIIDLWKEGPEDVKASARTRNAYGSIMGRYLDDSNSPLNGAWHRLMCIDKFSREWGQPYYAINPDEGKQIRLN